MLLDTAGKVCDTDVFAVPKWVVGSPSPSSAAAVLLQLGTCNYSCADHNPCVRSFQVVTKGKPKVPKVLESGSILEIGNFCCEYDQEVPLEEFK